MGSFEQYEEVKPFWGWVVVFGFSLGVMAWAMVLHLSVGDPPRQWDFGALPGSPGESIYTTAAPPPAEENPPPQMQTLPEARPPAARTAP